MRRITAAVLGGLGVALGGAVAYSIRHRRETEEVPHVILETVEGIELRQYPAAVAVETEASSDREAFGRLFRYLSGANRERTDVSMTAPVETVVGATGQEVAMTGPVRTSEATAGGGVQMSFYLPAGYGYGDAPRPTEDGVHLVAVPERVVAVRQFSWWTTPNRVAAQTRRLEDVLHRTSYRAVGEPSLLRYDSPWTLPFLRRNEVAVTVRPGR